MAKDLQTGFLSTLVVDLEYKHSELQDICVNDTTNKLLLKTTLVYYTVY